MIIPEKEVHGGHRSRMRSKLLAHGSRIFDSYELLEMLLYYTIPQKDTNPLAKSLLATFGGLSGVFGASVEELSSVPGIGSKTAKLISLVGGADRVGELSAGARPKTTFNDFCLTGRFFANYFKKNPTNTVIMLLDDAMRLLGVADIETPKFGSAATRPRPFLDAALRYRASIAVVAYTHRNGLIYPFESDIVTCKMLEAELSTIGVSLVECYIVSGDNYARSGPKRMLKSTPTPELLEFDRSRSRYGDCSVFSVVGKLSEFELSLVENANDLKIDALKDYLSELLPYAGFGDDGLDAAERLAGAYGSLDTLLSQSDDTLISSIGECGAVLLKLTAALTSRAVTDAYAFGSPHSDKDTVRYIHALMHGTSVETVYLLSYDGRGRVKACDFLGEGTVNASEVYQRRVAECAVKRSAAYVVLVHNHPTGAAAPSEEDLGATATLFATCRAVGVRLHRHIIVAERDHCVLEIDPDDGIINNIGRIC